MVRSYITHYDPWFPWTIDLYDPKNKILKGGGFMRKKSRMIALALAAVMALTACSSNSDSPAASEADKTTAAGQEADSTSGTEAGTPHPSMTTEKRF